MARETNMHPTSLESAIPMVGSPTRRTIMNMLVASATLSPALAYSRGGDDHLLALFQEYKEHKRVLDEHSEEEQWLHDSWVGYGQTLFADGQDQASRWELIKQHPDAIAHTALSRRLEPHYARADKLVEEILNTPASTTEGKRAKLIVLFGYLMHDDFLEQGEDCDYEKRKARLLFCEFAQITEQELLQAI